MPRKVTTPAPDEVIEILKARNIDPTPDAIRSFYLHWTLDSIRAKFDRNSYREEGRVEGFAEGRAEGREEGRVEGFAEGREEGRAEGMVQGFAKAQTKTFDAMMKFMKISGLANFTPEQISQCREYINNTLAGSDLNHA